MKLGRARNVRKKIRDQEQTKRAEEIVELYDVSIEDAMVYVKSEKLKRIRKNILVGIGSGVLKIIKAAEEYRLAQEKRKRNR